MTTETLTPEHALEIATLVANDDATVGIHHGDTRSDVGIRITGCDATAARRVAMEIARALCRAEDPAAHDEDIADRASRRAAIAAGFVCVWL